MFCEYMNFHINVMLIYRVRFSHDWPKAECLTILKNTKSAMKPTSRLLIRMSLISMQCAITDHCEYGIYR